MPRDAPKIKIDNTRGMGAEIILYDRVKESREEIGEKIAIERGLTLVKPYDEPYVIAGQGTVGLEISEQIKELNVSAENLLVCCGGGGLTSGIATSMASCMPDIVVRPVEPKGFDDVARSLIAGKIERNTNATGSICDAIVTPQPGDLTFPIMNQYCGPGLVVSDEECLKTIAIASSRLKIVLEPGGAVALATSDVVLMLEHSIYSVISPEGCASILWRSADMKSTAAEAQKLTAQDLLHLKIIDGIIKEPLGGAHRDHKKTIEAVKGSIKDHLASLSRFGPDGLKKQRRQKYLQIGKLT